MATRAGDLLQARAEKNLDSCLFVTVTQSAADHDQWQSAEMKFSARRQADQDGAEVSALDFTLFFVVYWC
ncbi:MAG: hypothetical protein U5L02_07955 [Rheinheimera sp.]|nr:hypothetical protein [Rheinheimera sp.]